MAEARRASARLVPLALAAAIVGISFASIFIRCSGPTHPLIVAAGRLAIAALVLAVPTVQAWRSGRIPPRVRRAAVAGGLFYAIHFGSWVSSLAMTSIA